MGYTKLKVYYQGDGSNLYTSTTSQLEKKYTVTLPVQVKKYGDENGYDEISITHCADHLILKGGNGKILFDRDINGDNNDEYITKITRYEWIGDDYVEPKPLNKYSKIKVYHNWQGDGRTLTLPLSKECVEYGDRYGYDTIKVSKTGWEFAMANKEGGTMVYKSFLDCDVNSGVGKVIKIEWLNAEIESEIKKLKNKFTKVKVNHGANSKMTIALPKKLTEFGDRYGYDKITFARNGCSFYLYDPDGFILLRKDCWETGLGEIKSMEWLNDKSESVPFKPAPSPFEIPVEETAQQPVVAPEPSVAAPAVEQTAEPVAESTPSVEESVPQKKAGGFRVILVSAGVNKLEVIKAVKEAYGLDLAVAKNIIDSIPCTLEETESMAVAEEVKINIEKVGAKVDIKPIVIDGGYDVVLVSAGVNKLEVIKAVKQALAEDLRVAKNLVDSCPSILKGGLSKGEALEIKKIIEDAGAKIQINPDPGVATLVEEPVTATESISVVKSIDKPSANPASKAVDAKKTSQSESKKESFFARLFKMLFG